MMRYDNYPQGKMCTQPVEPPAETTHGCQLTTRGNGGRDGRIGPLP